MNRVSRSSSPAVLVVYKRSTYERYGGTADARVARLLARRDVSVAHLLEAHRQHERAVARVRTVLQKLGTRPVFKFKHTPKDGDRWDLVVTLGGDGTLLWTSHMVGPRTPMVAINSAPVTSVGYFCAGTTDEAEDVLADALAGRMRRVVLTRMQVEVDREVVSRRVLNDVLFSHDCPAAATRYVLGHGRIAEEQVSSGLWVGPAAGSTAAQRSAGGRVLPPGSRKIQYVVREPYHGLGPKLRLVKGLVSPGEALSIRSQIREGKLFLDGHNRTVPVDIGSEIRLSASSEPLTLLGLRRLD